jgi:hypothetical protein
LWQENIPAVLDEFAARSPRHHEIVEAIRVNGYMKLASLKELTNRRRKSELGNEATAGSDVF